MADDFELEIFAPSRADVYVDVSDGNVPWSVVEQLDQSGIRSIGDLADADPDDDRVRRIMSGCSAVMTDRPPNEAHCRGAHAPRRRSRRCRGDRCRDLDPDPAVRVPNRSTRARFLHPRQAMRVAVEREAGIPLVWIDDGRHRSNVESVRQRTRLLIRHAAFVIADLTLGVESPERENPSRAHEIGMAVAYDRRLMLSSQEPRRYPYFSIGDMQMSFWETEDELERNVAQWIRPPRKSVSRRVFNAELASVGHISKVSPPTFSFDPAKRFIGPNLDATRALRVLPR